MRAALPTIAVLGMLPWAPAAAGECDPTLGRGYPPAAGALVTTVTCLLDGGTMPALSLLTRLTRGVDRAVSLVERWIQIESSLDEFQQTLAGTTGGATGETNGGY